MNELNKPKAQTKISARTPDSSPLALERLQGHAASTRRALPSPCPHSVGPLLLTVDEVGALLRTSRKAVYAMAERGQLPGIARFGRRLLFRRDLLLDWVCQKSASSLEGVQR